MNKTNVIQISDEDEHFRVWLTEEIERRGLSQAEVARRSGMSAAMLSLVMTGKRPIGLDGARGVARALNLDEMYVLRLAGLVRESKVRDEIIDEWSAILHLLDDTSRTELMQHATVLLENQQDQEFVRKFRTLGKDDQAVGWSLIEEFLSRKGMTRVE